MNADDIICSDCGQKFLEQDCGIGFRPGLSLTIVCSCGKNIDVSFVKRLFRKKLKSEVTSRG
jgi:hypothetical protein